jgi:hypothetical protein
MRKMELQESMKYFCHRLDIASTSLLSLYSTVESSFDLKYGMCLKLFVDVFPLALIRH